MKPLHIALCGNPNVGKSTVFNALTGLSQHTGNWTGKTVESAQGNMRSGSIAWTLTDLPGCYSLFHGSPEEMHASDFLTFRNHDAVIVVCDATCLERNLNLALQVSMVCPKTVLCINMMDEAVARGIQIDLSSLENRIKMPVVGITAKSKRGLDRLIKRTTETTQMETSRTRIPYKLPEPMEEAIGNIEQFLLTHLSQDRFDQAHFIAMRLLLGSLGTIEALKPALFDANITQLQTLINEQTATLLTKGYPLSKCVDAVISQSYRTASYHCRQVISKPDVCAIGQRHLRIDQALCSKHVGIALMLALLALVFYITLVGANLPSQWLTDAFHRLETSLLGVCEWLHFPTWLTGALVYGMYRVASWVIAVMLPPMAIFFPLFTLLEDIGYLPRVAFNMDRCFQKCHACGKQALCMLQGLGCNAVGVMGCRIIQSPRERLIAILTNVMIPCNGRFPTLILLISMFFVFTSGVVGSILSAILLTGLIVLGVAMTLLSAKILSKTILKGMPSSFVLELPPFRKPKVGEVLIRSLLDRTLFVLGRAIVVAAPAGIVLWLLGYCSIDGETLLSLLAAALDPIGKALGMDGVMMLAFLFGLPANEIVMPIALMVYLSQGSPIDPSSVSALKELLVSNGWTAWTALSVMLFSLFHWPCSTTLLTIKKETGSIKWTMVAFVLPTLIGCACCLVINGIRLLIGA